LEVVRDPKDRYLLEAAIQHDVDILVSGDKDLLAMARFLEVPRIMSPAEFVAEFGEADQ
jgi:predicted nucleic acid-binding protein